MRDVRVICTAPDGIRLVVVKVETTEPGLYGLGLRDLHPAAAGGGQAIEQYLKPLMSGRDVHDIEDIYQAAFVSSYWRSGPVLNNALSGVDQALWDIKGKLAGMPVYQLLGGKCREAAAALRPRLRRTTSRRSRRRSGVHGAGVPPHPRQVAVPGYSTYGVADQAKGRGTQSDARPGH